jgi:hypothetical protein
METARCFKAVILHPLNLMALWSIPLQAIPRCSQPSAAKPEELRTLPEADIVTLHLDYRESRRTDEHGNQFRYRAKVKDAQGARAGRWAWDVFLITER